MPIILDRITNIIIFAMTTAVSAAITKSAWNACSKLLDANFKQNTILDASAKINVAKTPKVNRMYVALKSSVSFTGHTQSHVNTYCDRRNTFILVDQRFLSLRKFDLKVFFLNINR